jgi:hypothetical protein
MEVRGKYRRNIKPTTGTHRIRSENVQEEKKKQESIRAIKKSKTNKPRAVKISIDKRENR